ncbi:unnamed protein product, partial [Ectocarpus sp. 6 AP-2014]
MTSSAYIFPPLHPPHVVIASSGHHTRHASTARGAKRKATSEKKPRQTKILRRGTLDMREPSDQVSLARLMDEQVGLLRLDKKLLVYGCCCASTYRAPGKSGSTAAYHADVVQNTFAPVTFLPLPLSCGTQTASYPT